MNTLNNTQPYTLSLEEYCSLPVTIDPDNHRNNSFLALMDVWGEANHAMQTDRKDEDKLRKQLKALHDVCNIIYSNSYFDHGLKWELMVAEWELNDYLLGDNIRGYNEDNIMSWFNEWCYSINYDLLSLEAL